MKHWTDSSGCITLKLTSAQATAASHPGQCDADVAALCADPKVSRHLSKMAPADIAAALREYGAWSDAELSDNAQNLRRLVWIAAGDISEGNCF